MVRRIVAAVIAFSALLFLYALYVAAFRRLWDLQDLPPELLPTAPQVAQWQPPASTTDIAHQVAIETFGEDAWQAKAVISLYWADQGIFLYANRYEFPTKRTMVLKPVSVVRRRPTPEGETDYVVLTAEQAELQFARPISLANFSEVKPLMARATGNVRIAWNRGSEDPADDLYVELEEVTFHRRKQAVWATGAVTITTEQFTLQGRDGRITLKEEDDALRVESFQLNREIRLDAMVSQEARRVLGSRSAEPSEQQALRLTCNGPLVIDAQRPMATFRGNVVVHLQTPGQVPDRLEADELRLTFIEPPEGQPPQNTPQFVVDEVVAMGQPVRLLSPSRKLEATAVRMTYDHSNRSAELVGDGELQARYGSFVLHVRRLELAAPEGSGVKAKAPGPGRLVSADGQGFEAHWQDEALLDTEGAEQVAVLKGNVQVVQAGRGQLRAQRAVRLWFTPQDQTDKTDGRNVRPQRIEATGNVILTSRNLTLRTNLLTATFEAPTPEAARRTQPRFRWVLWQEPRRARVKVHGIRPAGEAPDTPDRQADDPKPGIPPTGRHLDIEAQQVRVTLAEANGDMDARELWAQGAVQIHQRRPKGSPTSIAADTVHLKRLSQGYFFEIKGKPATIQAENLTIQGPTIGFDQPTQVAWVQGAGQMDLTAGVSLTGEAPPTGSQIQIKWQQEMFFDGLVAEFGGDVRVTQEQTTIRCEKLEVFLSERVSLTEGRPEARKVSVSKLVARSAVELRSETETSTTLVTAPALVYDRAENRIVVSGPGSFWLASFGNPAPLAPGDTAEASPQWNGTLALFEQLMEVEQGERRLVRFVGRVRVWHAPLADRSQTFSRDNPPQNAIAISCDQLELVTASTGPTLAGAGQIERFVARGNARVEGRGFYAHADLLKYDAANGEPKLVAEATGNGFATFYRQTVPGRRPDVLRARKVYYWPRTGEFRQEGGIMLDVRGNPSLPTRR